MTNMQKAFRTVKILRGFTIRIGLPFALSLWIAKKLFPPKKDFTEIKIESGWVRDSVENYPEEDEI